MGLGLSIIGPVPDTRQTADEALEERVLPGRRLPALTLARVFIPTPRQHLRHDHIRISRLTIPGDPGGRHPSC